MTFHFAARRGDVVTAKSLRHHMYLDRPLPHQETTEEESERGREGERELQHRGETLPSLLVMQLTKKRRSLQSPYDRLAVQKRPLASLLVGMSQLLSKPSFSVAPRV